MIRYALKCRDGHSFESWFQSGAAYDRLRGAGHVSCPECGDTAVEKAPMAPQLARGETRNAREAQAGTDARAERLARLRRHIEASSDYVGEGFASEARRIHAGEAEARMIHGEARPAEAKALIEEGVPIAPLPFAPRRRTN